MPRVARSLLVAEGTTNHCTWQTHNLELALDAPGAREKLRALFLKYKEKHGIRIRSYCLMGTHPHVVCMSERGQEAFSKFWKVVNQCFARWYNKQQNRRGQVVMERLASPRIQDERHALEVMRYGDDNPVQAGLVKSPKDWNWSSHRHYAYGETDPLIDDAPEYLALGKFPADRRKAYLHLFAEPLRTESNPEDVYVRAPFIGDAGWVDRMKASLDKEPPRRPP